MANVETAHAFVGSRRRKAGELSPQQHTFVQSLARQGNIITAYRQAGYATADDPRTPKQLRNAADAILRGAGVRAALDEFRKALEHARVESQGLTKEWIIAELQLNFLECKRKGDCAAGNRALELLGKHLGMFSDTLHIDLGQMQAYAELGESEARRLAILMCNSTDMGTDMGQCEHIDHAPALPQACDKPDLAGEIVVSGTGATPSPPDPPRS